MVIGLNLLYMVVDGIFGVVAVDVLFIGCTNLLELSYIAILLMLILYDLESQRS